MSYPSSQPLLTTKLLIPRLRQSLVLRPRLAQTLDAALERPLLLISAPAGFGKTTLAAAWVQQQQLPVAWLALDAADNDPHSFLRYLLAALQAAQPTVGRDLAAALNISNDDFIRTTEERHIKSSQEIWRRMAKAKNYSEWLKCAERMDELEGKNKWREVPECQYYNHRMLQVIEVIARAHTRRHTLTCVCLCLCVSLC